MIETKFFVRIRGAFTPPPTIDEPVVKMPTAAPITDKEIARPTPRDDQRNGETPKIIK